MRVLVVEDDMSIGNFLRSTLEQEHFAVDLATDGERGAYLGKTNDYDLIVLDNVTPKKHGLSVCKDIRASGKQTPILSLSVQSDLATKVALLNAGADDYLTKPFSAHELLARIRAILRRPNAILGEVLTLDDLVLDTRKHTVTRDGMPITLTRKEFMLLAYLVRNQNVAIPRSELLEHVWDLAIDPFSNTIESHIFTLRKKIDRKGKKKLIHTVSGTGYKAAVFVPSGI